MTDRRSSNGYAKARAGSAASPAPPANGNAPAITTVHQPGGIEVPARLVVRPNLDQLKDATGGIPFSKWAHPEHQHRSVTRGELLAIVKVFVRPLQDAVVLQHKAILALQDEVRRPWYAKLWRWLLAPIQRPERVK